MNYFRTVSSRISLRPFQKVNNFSTTVNIRKNVAFRGVYNICFNSNPTSMKFVRPANIIAIRFMSSSDKDENNYSSSEIAASTNNADLPVTPGESIDALSDVAVEVITSGANTTLNTFWPLSHPTMTFIDSFHQMTGLPYWETIVVLTLGLRCLLLPLAIKTQQATAR
jgi:membrane protein insertase Oxa1/YidC/SpoIIIJ